jgi:hypothetical protein
VIPLLLAAYATAQIGADKKTAASASPKINATFAKAAIKTLLTIEGTRNKELLDAEMIDLSAYTNDSATHFNQGRFVITQFEGKFVLRND